MYSASTSSAFALSLPKGSGLILSFCRSIKAGDSIDSYAILRYTYALVACGSGPPSHSTCNIQNASEGQKIYNRAEVALLRIQLAIYKMLRRGKRYTIVRKWRNWHTRRSQKPVLQGLRVQIPPSAPCTTPMYLNKVNGTWSGCVLYLTSKTRNGTGPSYNLFLTSYRRQLSVRDQSYVIVFYDLLATAIG